MSRLSSLIERVRDANDRAAAVITDTLDDFAARLRHSNNHAKFHADPDSNTVRFAHTHTNDGAIQYTNPNDRISTDTDADANNA